MTGVRAGIGVFVSAAGVSASLTVLFLGMRSVMEIGCACAEGGRSSRSGRAEGVDPARAPGGRGRDRHWAGVALFEAVTR